MDLDNLNLSELPSVTASEMKSLPMCSGVYIAFNSRGVLYVGQSKCIKQRWGCHNHKGRVLRHPGTRIAWIETKTAEETLALENALIVRLKPEWNKLPARLANWRAADVQSRATHDHMDVDMVALGYALADFDAAVNFFDSGEIPSTLSGTLAVLRGLIRGEEWEHLMWEGKDLARGQPIPFEQIRFAKRRLLHALAAKARAHMALESLGVDQTESPNFVRMFSQWPSAVDILI